MSAQIKDGGAVDVLAVFAEAASWLPYDGDDNRIRERFNTARAAVAELTEVGNAWCDLMPGLAGGPEFDRLVAALARVGGAK